jgi:D-sedoheptulose 7-phosphate isomerase
MKPSESALKEIERLLSRYPALSDLAGEIRDALERILDTLESGGTILTAGNGGSSADAVHIVGELMKSFQLPRSLKREVREAIESSAMPEESRRRLLNGLEMPLRARSLVEELALTTAFANDADPQLGFAQQLLGSAREGDLFLPISTSGNSENLVVAARLARALGLSVVALTGKDGGQLATVSDVAIVCPGSSTAEIQEYHLPVYHALCAAAEAHFFFTAHHRGD